MNKNTVYVLIQFPAWHDPREHVEGFQALLDKAGIEHRYVPPKCGTDCKMEIEKAVIYEHYLQKPLQMNLHHPAINCNPGSLRIRPSIVRSVAPNFEAFYISVIGYVNSGKTALIQAFGAQFETAYLMTNPFEKESSGNVEQAPFVTDDELVARLQSIKDSTSVVIGGKSLEQSEPFEQYSHLFNAVPEYAENDIDLNAPRINCFGQDNVFKGIAELFKEGYINEPQMNILSVCAARVREGDPVISLQLLEYKEDDATYLKLAVLVDNDVSVSFTVHSTFYG